MGGAASDEPLVLRVRKWLREKGERLREWPLRLLAVLLPPLLPGRSRVSLPFDQARDSKTGLGSVMLRVCSGRRPLSDMSARARTASSSVAA